MAFTYPAPTTATSTPTPQAVDTLTAVTYDTDTAVGLRGFRVSSTQLFPEGSSTAIAIGTAAGQARNIRLPQPVKLQDRTYKVSSAIATFDAFVVPAQNATVAVTNGVIVGGAAADIPDVITAGTLLFAVSATGSLVAGLYEVVSGTIAALVVRRVDNNVISLALSANGTPIQTLATIGQSTAVAMQFGVYTRIQPLVNEFYRTIEIYVNDNVLSGALSNINSTNAADRSQSIADVIQADSRAVACSTVLSSLISPIGNRDYFGDSSSRDYLLGDLTLYLHGMGTATRPVWVRISHYAGYYPGGAAYA
jgi:hypothetical protein